MEYKSDDHYCIMEKQNTLLPLENTVISKFMLYF